MERKELVEEIVRRVSEKLAAMEPGTGRTAPEGAAAAKPGLLILTQEHGTDCHSLLKSGAVQERYRTDCALAKHYDVDMDDYEAVVLYDLSCGALSALASGIWSCAYTRLASQAILSGKRVYIPAEEVELYRYKGIAPAPYYGMLQRKLSMLSNAGVVICARSELEQLLLSGETSAAAPDTAEPPACAPAQPCGGTAAAEVRIDKRVLTERDVISAQQAGSKRICVAERCIITALAADLAAGRGIAIIRDGE